MVEHTLAARGGEFLGPFVSLQRGLALSRVPGLPDRKFGVMPLRHRLEIFGREAVAQNTLGTHAERLLPLLQCILAGPAQPPRAAVIRFMRMKNLLLQKTHSRSSRSEGLTDLDFSFLFAQNRG